VKVFCVNGISLSGKDSFVNRVKAIKNKDFQNVKCISTIDPVKDIYKRFFGWDGTKSDIHRKNLNVLKRIWIDVCNGPLVWTQNQIMECCKKHTEALFIMVREFSEMELTLQLAKTMGFEAHSVVLIRPGIPIPPIEQEFLNSHPLGYLYDITIFNPTTEKFPYLPVLDSAVENFMLSYLSK